MTLCAGAFAGCGHPVNDDGIALVKKEYPFANYSSEFTLPADKMSAYFYEGGNVPYMDIIEFTDALNGFLDADAFSSSVNEAYNVFTLSWKYENALTMYLAANWETDEIYVNHTSFFGNTVAFGETDYMYALQYGDSYLTGANGATFRLGDYGFDILYYRGKCLVPFCVLNTLFCSQNMYNVCFNGDEFFGVYFLPAELDGDTYQRTRQSSLNGTDCPDDVREATLNHLCFVMDYFYGLRGYKQIGAFEDLLEDGTRAALLSRDPAENKKAYVQIFQKTLDDMHTALSSSAFYNAPGDTIDLFAPEALGERWAKFYAVYSELYAARTERWDGTNPPVVRFAGDTAIVTLDEFVTGTQEQIYDGGAIRDDAWKYDSFFRMRAAMQAIEEHGGVSDIILDLSLNGGGNVGAMARVLGYLTDEPVPLTNADVLTGSSYVEYLYIDTDLDNDVTDKDSYDKYDWFVLTSNYTFSAANTFTSICKDMGIAAVIGEQSGGGMCSVMPVILADGTALQMSSNNCSQSVTVRGSTLILDDIEGGIAPEHALARGAFYADDAYLDSFVGTL